VHAYGWGWGIDSHSMLDVKQWYRKNFGENKCIASYLGFLEPC
jgi:hypothetical protein